MSNIVDSLILDLLEWIDPNARPYSELCEEPVRWKMPGASSMARTVVWGAW